jgi:hypothetical protein
VWRIVTTSPTFNPSSGEGRCNLALHAPVVEAVVRRHPRGSIDGVDGHRELRDETLPSVDRMCTQCEYLRVMCSKPFLHEREADERLRVARRHPTESFSDVVRGASRPEDTATAGDLLRRYRKPPVRLSDEGSTESRQRRTSTSHQVDK